MSSIKDGPDIAGADVSKHVASGGPYPRIISLLPGRHWNFDDENFYCCKIISTGAGVVNALPVLPGDGVYQLIPIAAHGALDIRIDTVNMAGTTATGLFALGYDLAVGG